MIVKIFFGNAKEPQRPSDSVRARTHARTYIHTIAQCNITARKEKDEY